MTYRDKLRDQNELSNEVMNAISSNPLGQDIDETELEDELEQLQQEKLDEQILSTGNVPVSDAVHRMPTAARKERELLWLVSKEKYTRANNVDSSEQGPSCCGRRGGGIATT